MNKLKLSFFLCLQFMVGAGTALATQINTNSKLEIKSDDSTFSARFTGMFHLDGDFYKSGSPNRHLPSGTFMRRARLGMEGNFREWEYAIESDFATNQTTLQTAFLRRLIGPGKVTVGQFKVFEGLEEVTSANEITFIERSYVSSIVPGFKLGAAYNGATGKLGYSGTMYNTREASDDEARPTNSGIGLVGRAYFAPINKRMLALHFGASYAHENTDSIGARVRVEPMGRAQNYRDLTDFRFVVFDRQNERAQIHRLNFESVAIDGPLSFQGEYLIGSVDTDSKVDDKFSAWYGQVSYILTGEWRRYTFLTGELKRPQPSRAAGAVEIAARHQQAKRNIVDGAKVTGTEFGVTYYANLNVRFMVNYGLANNKLNGDKPRLLSFRAQFDF